MALILADYYMTKKFSHLYDVYRDYYQCLKKITKALSALVILKHVSISHAQLYPSIIRSLLSHG